jgi:hypothetical protein
LKSCGPAEPGQSSCLRVIHSKWALPQYGD